MLKDAGAAAIVTTAEAASALATSMAGSSRPVLTLDANGADDVDDAKTHPPAARDLR
jgi:hypothetical protein